MQVAIFIIKASKSQENIKIELLKDMDYKIIISQGNDIIALTNEEARELKHILKSIL